MLTSDVSLKVKLFTVGFHELGHGLRDLEYAGTIARGRSSRSTSRSGILPFVTERLIRSPLRRPFEGAGSMFRIGVRDSAGAQTVLVAARAARRSGERDHALPRLARVARARDLDDQVEHEEDRFLRDVFVALQADLRALATR